MLNALAKWLASTSLSEQLQTITWAIPNLQSVHIVALAFLMGSAWLFDLRLLGLKERSQPVGVIAHRFLPWIWWALAVLVVSGGLLVTAEPAALLGNSVFLLKMILLAVAVAVTLAIQRMALQVSAGRTASIDITTGFAKAGPALKALAVVSLLLWVAIAFAGRLIAYVG
jgi:uncharacterized membrane protein